MSGPDEGDDAGSPPDRRHEDEEFLASLRATGLRGPAYEEAGALFFNYGTGVLWKMVRNEQIWVELVKVRRARTRSANLSEHDKEQLIRDSVSDAYVLDFLQKVVIEDRWDPSRASLHTLFVRYCLGRFAEHYRAWQRRPLPWEILEDRQDLNRIGLSAEREALARCAVAELSLEQLAHGIGLSHKEIGQMLGISDRAVEGRLYRSRGQNSEHENE
ncbi:DNA-directed RNA polymerase specialized sigma subunit, sigma24 family [Amycolatopsis lurida]|uniref:RNA polymerase sigma factor 70 region 4 type 2 domain-containing protein n=1 Tax=Amycolatopsis lurida NRRL 2430 TaxID=1460371 RepID=A0A2P2FFE0_AMYLU|nr:sigma-70 family RNA polymerase sigma factor [Amycolatopsis lurida]KFU75434.1 hypothetical protein BB31_41475 [Amycolatopsis lurida NRRL 2430]SEC85113.1 DNA-directed RNA polymerase specialized sigma subunit, sigma24 family [Amycolatopsis lurida]